MLLYQYMEEAKKKEILLKFDAFFKGTIAVNHLENLEKLRKISSFDLNPFLLKYLAAFLTGDTSSKSLAMALIYPRILGTSITTSFGQNLQNAASDIFEDVFGSPTAGIDLEFIDQIDHRKKYCQIKSGPNTINYDDIETISQHFTSIRNIARVNKLDLGINDLVVGVLYGEPHQLSSFYNKLGANYPIFVGQEFWERVTGDKMFYLSLIDVFGQAAKETNAKALLDSVVDDLASDIEEKIISSGLIE